MVFADPPYNLSGKRLQWKNKQNGGNWYMLNEPWDSFPAEEYREFALKWIEEVDRVLVPGGTLWICATLHNLRICLDAVDQVGLRLVNLIVWQKPNPMPNMTRKLFTHSCEYVLFCAKGSNWVFNYEALKQMNPDRRKDGGVRQMRDAWTIPLCQGKERLRRNGDRGRSLHPAQKPLEIVRRAVVASTHPDQVVLDPFMGTGTTAVVCDVLGRRWVGIERSPLYASRALRRIQQCRRAP